MPTKVLRSRATCLTAAGTVSALVLVLGGYGSASAAPAQPTNGESLRIVLGSNP